MCHSPYLRGLDVGEDGIIYATATGCRGVVKITPDGKVETILKAEQPWTPTGVGPSCAILTPNFPPVAGVFDVLMGTFPRGKAGSAALFDFAMLILLSCRDLA